MGAKAKPSPVAFGEGFAASGSQDWLCTLSVMNQPLVVVDVSAVPVGQRNHTLRETAFAMGHAGASNHEILAALSGMSDAMNKYTDANLYEKWTRLLGFVREVRRAGIQAKQRE